MAFLQVTNAIADGIQNTLYHGFRCEKKLMSEVNSGFLHYIAHMLRMRPPFYDTHLRGIRDDAISRLDEATLFSLVNSLVHPVSREFLSPIVSYDCHIDPLMAKILFEADSVRIVARICRRQIRSLLKSRDVAEISAQLLGFREYLELRGVYYKPTIREVVALLIISR